MKKFIVYLLVIVLTVSLGFAIFYLVRDNEVISISSASIYKDAGDSFTLEVDHVNKKASTEITVTSSDEDVVDGSFDKKSGQYKATAHKGGVARINVRTSNAKFRNLWCDIIVGDGTIESPYYISTAEQLASIGMGVEIKDENNVGTGVYAGAGEYEKYHSNLCYKLVANINASDVNNGFWVPLQNFNGRFDGNGHTISNIYIDAEGYKEEYGDNADIRFMTGKNAGMFASVGSDSVVYNFKLDNYMAIGTYDNFGTISAINQGTIERIEVKDAYLSIKANVTGGLVGRNETTKVYSVIVDEQGNETAKWTRRIARLDRNSVIMTLGQARNVDSNGNETISVVGTTGTIGGLAGVNNGGTIVYCYARGQVFFGDDSVNTITYGGLVGLNSAINAMPFDEENGETEYQGASLRDCYSDLSTNLLATPSANSLFGGVLGTNLDFKKGDFETDDDKIDHVVNNYLIGLYYNKDNLNIAQDGISKEFSGIGKFTLGTDSVEFTEKETIVLGLTKDEMKDMNKFISHTTQELVFNSDGTSKGIVEKKVLYLFETVWAINANQNDGMPYLNYQLIYIPDDFKSVGMPIVAESMDEYYFDIEIHYPVSILSGSDGKVRLKVDEYYQLVYSPTGIEMEWTSSDSTVVTVDNNGKLYGVKVGMATVTVTTKSGSEASITVIVENIAYNIKAPASIYLYQGQQFDLETIDVTPAPQGKDTISYTVLNQSGELSDIAHVSGKKLIASETKTGNATLRIQIADTRVDVPVQVVEVPSVKLSASPSNVSGYIESMSRTGIITITSNLSEAFTYKTEIISGTGVVSATVSDNIVNYTISGVGSATLRVSIVDELYEGSVDIYFNIKANEALILSTSPSSVSGYYSTIAKTGYITISNNLGRSLEYDAKSTNTSVVSVVNVTSNVIKYAINGAGTGFITISVASANYSGSEFVDFTIYEDSTEPDYPDYPDFPDFPDYPDIPDDPIESVDITQSSITIYVGETYSLQTTGTDSTLSWSSNATSVATVNRDGVVTGKAVGSAIITASCTDDSDICVVNVIAKPAQDTYSISISPSTLSMGIGDSRNLSISGNLSTFALTSSSSTVISLTVDEKARNATITALKAGTATITATAKDASGNAKAYAYCTVTVTASDTIVINRSTSSINVGESVTFTAKVNNGNSIKPTFNTSGPATFSTPTKTSNGWEVKATATGAGTIKVTASYNSVSASTTCTVTQDTAYSAYIYNLNQLNNIRYHLDKDFYLAANINVGSWKPIENFTGSFSNTGSFTISNVQVSGVANAGLFGSVSNASFKKIFISNSTISGTTYAGAIAAKATNTSFDNCKVSNCSKITAGKYAGAIVGYMGSNSIITSTNVASNTVIVTSSTGYVGGIVGYAQSSSVSYCVVNGGTIQLSGAHGYAGGAVGNLNNSEVSDTLVYNSASISAGSADSDYAGGICGYTNGCSYQTISNCTVRGVTISGYNAGGIGGSLNDTGTITLKFKEYKSGYRSEDLSSSSYTSAVESTSVKSDVTIKGTVIGGFFGVIAAGVVENCYTQANLYGTSGSAVKGGFAAYIYASSSFNNTGGSGSCGLVRYCYSACSFSGSGTAYSITSSLVHNYASVGDGAGRAGYCMNYVFDDDEDGNAKYYDGSNIFSADKVQARKSYSEMQDRSTYQSKGFSSSYWLFSGYPGLKTDK